ncbi:MAG: hypothetical protein ACRBCJ_01590 [Hyphomicrobiaceae bacterium]
MQRRLQFLATLILAAIAATGLHAQTSKSKPATAKAAAGTNTIPGPGQLNLLIRTTIIAFNQANQTGNYSVLRDLASPSFQQANSQAKLAVIFAKIRARQLDLSPILFFDPKLIRKPQIQPNGLLRLSGFFDTRPERVVFDLQYQPVGPSWRLFGISIETRIAEDVNAKAPQAKSPKAKSTSKTRKKKTQGQKAKTTN